MPDAVKLTMFQAKAQLSKAGMTFKHSTPHEGGFLHYYRNKTHEAIINTLGKRAISVGHTVSLTIQELPPRPAMAKPIVCRNITVAIALAKLRGHGFRLRASRTRPGDTEGYFIYYYRGKDCRAILTMRDPGPQAPELRCDLEIRPVGRRTKESNDGQRL